MPGEDSGQGQRVRWAPGSFLFLWEFSPSLLRFLSAYELSSTCNSVPILTSWKYAQYQEDIVARMLFIAIIRTTTCFVFNRKNTGLSSALFLCPYIKGLILE